MEWSSSFLLRILEIVVADLVLAGDNAVIIAMAVKNLPERERRIGIAAGAGLAVLLRVMLTFFASKLLMLQFVKLAGGGLILWIGVKLLAQDVPAATGAARAATSLWQAMTYIMIADVTMSTDNILAVAGISRGHVGLLIFGLALSIPFVVFASNFLSKMMDRYPIIVYVGAAVLGRVGGEMIATDPYIQATLAPPHWVNYALQAALAIGVIAAGKWLQARAMRQANLDAQAQTLPESNP